ncbi:unnamed protein product [Mytilus coruscus]|uniref:Reverse transcriptase domain-containing protein n=1 Tax=Mytilus coruscus TaxID=42192 RepID=A0A6J8E0A5_MYTCO|nr:unnamed protein product [Mytilus coruscus]
MDLHVGDICMSGEQNVMEGFKLHFRNLATPEETTVVEKRQYHQEVEYGIGLITEIRNHCTTCVKQSYRNNRKSKDQPSSTCNPKCNSTRIYGRPRTSKCSLTGAVKWNGKTSELFNVLQGVRQGGILSTDLYKLFINPLLNMLETSNLGCRIGNILCNTSACADDVALMSKKTSDMQVQINMANTFAGMEGYKLQPKKKKRGYKHQN